MARPIVVNWTGARNPTKAELSAIRRAVRRGNVKSGATAGPARAVRTNRAARAYEEFHWGRKPKRTKRVKLPSYDEGLFELGRLHAVEYEARKGNEHAVYVHHFEPPYPILTGTPRGKLGPIIGGGAFLTSRGIEK